MDYETLRKMSNDGGDPQVALSRGEFAEKHGDLDGAIIDYSNAIKYKPDFILAYRYRALVYLNQAKYDFAIKDYMKAMELDNWTNKGFESLCEVLLRIQYISNLDKLSQLFIEKHPNNHFAHYYKALSQAQKNEIDASLSTVNNSIKLNDKYRRCWDLRAFLHTKKGEYYSAISDYEKALNLEPKNGLVMFNLATLYFDRLDDRTLGKKYMKNAADLGEKKAIEYLKNNKI